MVSRLRTLGLSGLVSCALLLVLVSYAQAAPDSQAAALTVADQALSGGALTVASVNAAQDGFLAAFRDDGGNPGALLGSTAVKMGAGTNVKIPITGAIANGTKVWVRLHIDAGTVGTLEFPGADVPAKDASGNNVQKSITVSAAAQAAATATPAASAATPVPATLPPTGGNEGGGTTTLVITALVLLALGVLLALRRRSGV